MLLPNHLPKQPSLIYIPAKSAIDIAHFPESSPILGIIKLFNLCETIGLLLFNFSFSDVNKVEYHFDC